MNYGIMMKVQSLTVSNPPHPPLQSQKAHYFDWKILNADHLSWDSFEASEELEMFLATLRHSETVSRKSALQTRSECWFFWTHLAGQRLPQNIVLRTDTQTLLHLAGERSGMFIRTNLQSKS